MVREAIIKLMIYNETYFVLRWSRELIKTTITYIISQMILVQTRRRTITLIILIMPIEIIRMITYSLQKIFSIRI